jgi:hypothetical protein
MKLSESRLIEGQTQSPIFPFKGRCSIKFPFRATGVAPSAKGQFARDKAGDVEMGISVETDKPLRVEPRRKVEGACLRHIS